MSDAGAYAREDLRTTVLIAYGLFLFALVNGFTAVAGVILLYVKRDDARGTLWESHFRNLIRLFWTVVVVVAAATAVALAALGSLIYTLVVTNGNPPPAVVGGLIAAAPFVAFGTFALMARYLYRTIRGLVRAADGEAY